MAFLFAVYFAMSYLSFSVFFSFIDFYAYSLPPSAFLSRSSAQGTILYVEELEHNLYNVSVAYNIDGIEYYDTIRYHTLFRPAKELKVFYQQQYPDKLLDATMVDTNPVLSLLLSSSSCISSISALGFAYCKLYYEDSSKTSHKSLIV